MKGLYQKYNIQKTNGNPVDPTAEYFVLRLDAGCKDEAHRKACLMAVLAYAAAIEDHMPELSNDLWDKYSDSITKDVSNG